MEVDPSDTSCTAIHNSLTGIDQTEFGFTVNPPVPQKQSIANPVIFPNITPGWYTLTATPPDPKWVATFPCIYRNGVFTGTIGYTANVNGGETVRWEIGYTDGTSWVQTEGGDVYASAILRSFIPVVLPRVFNDIGAGGSPGVVTYGANYDFDNDVFSIGRLFVSAKNWLVNATRTTVDYYDFFYHRFGAPTATDNALFANIAAVEQSELQAARTTPYYIEEPMTTSGNWSIGNGHSVVFIVDKNISFQFLPISCIDDRIRLRNIFDPCPS